MKRVLVISYYFPPFNTIGAVRVSKFCRYLPSQGWQPQILTVRDCDLPRTLALEVPEEAVMRTAASDVNWLPKLALGTKHVVNEGFVLTGHSWRSRLARALGEGYRQVLNFPDGEVGWYHHALRAARAAIRRQRPDMLFSSARPYTCHLVASRLSRETGIPWVAELRDLWTGNPHSHDRVWPLCSLERWLEERVLRQAQALVTVSEPIAATLRGRFNVPVEVITNGYDPQDYPAEVEPVAGFTLVYTGMINPGRRDPSALFAALAAMRAAGEIRPGEVQVIFVGRRIGIVRELALRYEVAEMVEIRDPVPYAQSLALQKAATALLLLMWNDPRERGTMTGKVFEYLGAGRPVLVIGPADNVAAELVSSTDCGYVAADSAGVRQILQNWLREYRETGSVACRPVGTESYQRSYQAEQLATLFDSISGRCTRVVHDETERERVGL